MSKITIPENLDATDLVERYYANKKIRADKKKNLIDGINYVTHTIISQSNTRRGRDRLEAKGYVLLNSQILNQIIGKKYKEVIDILETNNVIAVNNGYSSGSFSKGYTLTGKYISSKHKEVDFISHGIKHRYNIKLDYLNKLNEAELLKTPYINKWFNENLKIDEVGFHNFIEFYKRYLDIDTTKSLKKTNSVAHRYNSSLSSAEKIKNGDFNLKRTGKDNRLHSSVSSMKKEIRSYLKYNGEDLVGIDIKSSQPYLLNFLLNPDFYLATDDKIDIKTLHPELYKEIPIEEINSILMYGTYDKSFEDIDWTKDFYTELIAKEQSKFGKVKRYFKTRTEVKKKMMTILYDKKHKGKAFERFEALYPKIAALIKIFHSIGGKKDNHLPILMQRLESKLMLDNVAKVISKELPHAPIIPVHDSFMTTLEYQYPIYQIMERELANMVGKTPGLKLENISSVDIEKDFDKLIKEDLEEIYTKNSKYEYEVSIKEPMLRQFPKLNGKRILSTKYLPKEKF